VPLRDALRSRFHALSHRNFRLFWIGQLTSLIGTWMQSVAQGWLMHRLTGSAFMLGLLGFAQFLPVMFLTLWAGLVADRVDKRRLILVAQACAMAQAVTLAALVSTGGWAAVILHPDDRVQEFLGSKQSTTNNEMELLAAIHGLRQIPEGERATIVSDSAWLISCGSGDWQRHVYPDLWAELDALGQAHQVYWRKVRAHSGDRYNERADQLANLARSMIAKQALKDKHVAQQV